MKNKNYPFILCTVATIFLAFSLVLHSNGSLSMNANEGDRFNLVFSSSNKISNHTDEYDEENSTIRTANSNELTVNSSNVVAFNSGWQSILPGGYFYNPLTNSTHKNKLNGIKSIRYESNENNSLSLFYGYTINNNQIIYSHEKELSSNTTYAFDEGNPSFFYIENNSSQTIDINNLTIEYSCVESSYPMQDLKVLMIGNSFSDDTIYYAQRVASSYGINLEIYDAYIASCTINKHYENITQGKALYSMRRMNGSEWDYQNDKTLEEIVKYRSWDVISFQQASAEVGRHESYSNLSNLVNEVENRISNNPKLVWYQTWAYDQDYHDYYDYFSYFDNNQMTMFNAIIDCYEQEVAPLNIFNQMIPAGTAVQNMRTSYMNETFSRDGKHMSNVHGRYLLSVNFVSNLFDIDLDKSPCSYLPNEANESFKNVVKESVRNAYKYPLSISYSVYTTKETLEYDLSNYVEIDTGLVGCSFWNSTDSSNYNKRQGNVKETSEIYTSTKRFTQSELPIGSLVFIDEAFGVRPEAWINDTVQYDRPNDTYQNVIEIDNSFWDGYQYRAFNIFKVGRTTLLGQYDQSFNAFHIFVPKEYRDYVTIKGTNGEYENDKELFMSNSYNIDSFERLELNPIIGFYKCDSYYDLKNSYVDDTAKKFACTIPFYSSNNDLPENTIIVVDSGYQWRSDCWGDHGTYSPRPNNISTPLTKLGTSFWNGFRRRTFNVSSTSNQYVGQNALAFMNHLRIYVPISNEIYIEQEDTVTMAASGNISLNSTGYNIYGNNTLNMYILLHGMDTTRLDVKINSNSVIATKYTYDKSNGKISITTEGSVGGYFFGTIMGDIYPNQGRISNISFTGSFSECVTNNGSIECVEKFFDRCNYSSNEASQVTWQRWYMSGSWQANSGTGTWTTSNDTYLLDANYSIGLRIANSSYRQTRFTLRNDLNNGNGMNANYISIWIYNPNGNIYSKIRIYGYQSPSNIDGDHAYPQNYKQLYEESYIPSNNWTHIRATVDFATLYNISIFIETNSSDTTYLYLGHVSIY